MVALERRLQCQAITKKGTRCKFYALPGEKVCHVHIKIKNNQHENRNKTHSQSVTAIETSGRKNAESKKIKPVKSGTQSNGNIRKEEKKAKPQIKNFQSPGNIYVFTYAHMMHTSPTQSPYLNLAAPNANNWIDFNQVSPFDTSDMILIKVGYTRKNPETRINEWREQCKHSDFILLYPGCLVPVYKRKREKKAIVKLEALFKNLKISDNKKVSSKTFVMSKGKHTGRKYKCLNNENTCFVSSDPYKSEQDIHKILREKYGSGKMYCEGCAKNKSATDDRCKKSIGVHTEWFMVPRSEMEIIWDIIESQCTVQANMFNH